MSLLGGFAKPDEGLLMVLFDATAGTVEVAQCELSVRITRIRQLISNG